MLWYEVVRLLVFILFTGFFPDLLRGYFTDEIHFISSTLTMEFWMRAAQVVLVISALFALASKTLIFMIWDQMVDMLNDFWSVHFGMNNLQRWERSPFTVRLKRSLALREADSTYHRNRLDNAKLRMKAMLDRCMESGIIYENPLVLQCGHVVNAARYSEDRWCVHCNYQRRMNGLPNVVLSRIVEEAKVMKRFYDTM